MKPSRGKKPWVWVGGFLFLLMLFSSALAVQWLHPHKQAAREHLEHVLGQKSEPKSLPFQRAQPFIQVNSALQIPSVELKETAEAYELVVPMAKPEDERQIDLSVGTHQIKISGQMPLMGPDGKTVLGTSSFMKFFSTAEAVEPNRVTKVYQNQALKITIPKAQASSPPEALPPQPQTVPPMPRLPGQTLPPDLQRQLQHPQGFI